MKKKVSLIFCFGLTFFCGCAENNYDKIIYQLSDFVSNKKFEVEIKKENKLIYNYVIDDNSYFDKMNTYYFYKYQFLDGYEKYNNEIIETNFLDNNFISDLYKMIDITYINSLNYKKTNGCYVINETSLYKYNFNFLDDIFSSFKISKSDNGILYSLTGSDNYSIEFMSSDLVINPYGIKIDNYKNYYLDNTISLIKMNEKKENKEDFITILISESCSACEKVKKSLYIFQYEYQCNFTFIDIKDIENEKNDLINEIKNVYNNQIQEEKYDKYETYPDDFLTPTMIKFSNGKIEKVSIGINVNALHNFCFQNN